MVVNGHVMHDPQIQISHQRLVELMGEHLLNQGLILAGSFGALKCSY